jgi:peptide/nickel transport system substrate-binding protein
MYNRLVRFNSVSGGTLEPDLAELPEQPDESLYIFTLRPEARFWDRSPTNGRAVTAEDIRFNVERQQDALNANGDPDTTFYRQGDYARTETIAVQSEKTIAFTTSGPEATYLTTVHAGPWSWITSPEAVAEFGADWRNNGDDAQLNSGTGPYVPAAFGHNTNLSLRRSENWWKPDGAYLDGFILSRTPNAGIEAAYRNGTFDSVDFPLSNAEVRSLRDDFPEHPQHEFPLDTPVQFSYVLSDDPANPLSDPRVGRAIGIGIDRFAMIERLYSGEGRPSGPVPWFMDGWAIPEAELLEFPGYRINKDDDLPDLQALISAAGGADNLAPVEIVVPDLFEGFFPGAANTLSTMLERNVGITVSTRFASYEEITGQLQSGELPSFFGWGAGPRSADPTEDWLLRAHSEGSGNDGRYANDEVDELVETMRTTMDEAERKALAQQVQTIMLDTGYWVQNVANGIQLGISQPYIHIDPLVHDFAWSAHHLDTAWIDSDDAGYDSTRVLPNLPDDEPPAIDDDAADDGAADGETSSTDDSGDSAGDGG